MAKKKGRPKKMTALAHKATIHLRLPQRMREAVERLAERHGSGITEEVRVALRRYLESNQLWPPQVEPPSPRRPKAD